MASSTPPNQPVPESGLSFCPGDAALLSTYLPLMIARRFNPLDGVARFLHDTDVYAAEPEALVAEFLPAVSASGTRGTKCWYFFTYVKAKSNNGRYRDRTVGGGQGKWHGETAKKEVLDGEGFTIGYKKSLSYRPRNGKRSADQWLMSEYSLDPEYEAGKPVPVLCKIHRTAHKRHQSSFGSLSSDRKRKLTDERADLLAPSCPARRRLSFTPVSTPATASDSEGLLLMAVEKQRREASASNFSISDFLMSVVPEAGEMDDLASYMLTESIPPCASYAQESLLDGRPSLCSSDTGGNTARAGPANSYGPC